ncbi:peptidoglycan recognition protein family protein [Rhodopseudomonas telluris]|uniref:N-acetylmuramoyl-L-alanine amidase n=1 Tax=Rhodopseudomonas telluris TaxID=644215 RepID=A0ABV6ENS1_9BRAD
MLARLFGLALLSAVALPLQAALAEPLSPELTALARSAGTPDIPGLRIVWLAPWGDYRKAPWRNILVHQTEGPAGSARNGAREQAKNPTRRGVTIWVETDGTVYWAVPETVITTQGDGANRTDNKYIDNKPTYRQVTRANSIGIEFAGNYPDVTAPATPAQIATWRVLVRVLQARYDIPAERIYAHNWIDYKDARYCEGCELARLARDPSF